MRIIFMGTPEFSVPTLKTLYHSNHQVVCVYTQAPKAIGRGLKEKKQPIHETADSLGLPVYTPKTLRTLEAKEIFKNHQADIAVVVAYGLILPKEILLTPKKGCVNIHASLLPRWRGAAPIQRAILAGDPLTGLTFMRMDEGLDTGDMLYKVPCPISPPIRAQELFEKLSFLGASHILKVLDLLAQNSLSGEKQPQEGVTYAEKIKKEESHLDFYENAECIERKIRAFYPWPGVTFSIGEKIIKIHEAELINKDFSAYQPSTFLSYQYYPWVVVCKKGGIALKKVQKAGKTIMGVEEFLRGDKDLLASIQKTG